CFFCSRRRRHTRSKRAWSSDVCSSDLTIVASWVGRIIAIGFIGWSVITPLLAGERPEPLTVAWMSLIAIMLWFSAGDAATHAKRARKMETYDLSQVIQPAIAATWDADLAD